MWLTASVNDYGSKQSWRSILLSHFCSIKSKQMNTTRQVILKAGQCAPTVRQEMTNFDQITKHSAHMGPFKTVPTQNVPLLSAITVHINWQFHCSWS